MISRVPCPATLTDRVSVFHALLVKLKEVRAGACTASHVLIAKQERRQTLTNRHVFGAMSDPAHLSDDLSKQIQEHNSAMQHHANQVSTQQKIALLA